MAAVRIPQYTPQVGTPDGKIRGAEAAVPRSARMDLSGFDDLAAAMRRAGEETEANNARAELSAEEPKAQLAFATAFAERQKSWKPGDPPMAEQMTKVIDDYKVDADKRFTNPKTRELLAERSNEFKTSYGLKGLAFQIEAEVNNRVGDGGVYETMYQNIENVAGKDIKQFAPLLAMANATVQADTQVGAEAKRIFVEKKAKQAAFATTKSYAELFPQEAVAYANALLGVTEPVLTVPGVKNGADMYAAILKRESGGRMYDASGKVLRGPPIKTKDGNTIYAYGKAQLLESTAKAEAKEVGVPWQPDVFFRDKTGDPRLDAETAQYHDLLGKSYADRQNAQFGGNPVLIAAAYNMGPEAAKGWAEGRPYQTQSGKWWQPKKPMDMSPGALPEETRKYVQGLGDFKEQPVAASVDTSGEDLTAFRLLDTDSLIAVRAIAQSNLAELQRQRDSELAIGRDLFKQRVSDIEVALKQGDTKVTLPSDGELTTFLGVAGAALTKQKLLNYQQMAGGLKSLPSQSNEQLAALANMPDPEGADDRENRQFVRDTMAEQASKILAARKADPGQAAIDTSNVVRDTYAAWGAKAQEFYAAGQQATPEQFDSMAKAQADFLRISFAQQGMWGITQPKMPKEAVAAMAEGFRVQMERNPVQAAAYLKRLPDIPGSDEVVAQISAKLGSTAIFAMDGVPGITLAKLKAMRAIPEAKRAELLPEGTTKAQIQTAVRTAFDPLLASFLYQDDATSADRYREAGVILAMEKLGRDGGSVNEAAQSAYAELFADRNAVNGTYRVDTQRYGDAAVVARGLERYLTTLPAERLQADPELGFSLAESQERKARTMRQRAYWVNNAAGTGVLLAHKGEQDGLVRDAEGNAIEVLFDDAVKMKLPAPKPALRSGRGLDY